MRVLFVTDSLGAPRNHPEISTFSDIWCYQVATALRFEEPIYYNMNGLESNQLLAETPKKIVLYEADLLILQIGIVDCAPKVLTKTQLQIAIRLGPLSKLIRKTISRFHPQLSTWRNLAWVKREKFQANLEKFRSHFQHVPVIAVAIAPPNELFIKKSPLIAERVRLYNDTLQSIFKENFINPYQHLTQEDINDLFMADLHHLNKKGQTIVAHQVINFIKMRNLT